LTASSPNGRQHYSIRKLLQIILDTLPSFPYYAFHEKQRFVAKNKVFSGNWATLTFN